MLPFAMVVSQSGFFLNNNNNLICFMLYWEVESSFLDIGNSSLTGRFYSYVVFPSMGCEMPVVEVL